MNDQNDHLMPAQVATAYHLGRARFEEQLLPAAQEGEDEVLAAIDNLDNEELHASVVFAVECFRHGCLMNPEIEDVDGFDAVSAAGIIVDVWGAVGELTEEGARIALVDLTMAVVSAARIAVVARNNASMN